MDILHYFISNANSISIRTFEHIYIIGTSLLFAIVLGIPIGIYISSKRKIANIVIGIVSILFTIPSLALFGIMVIVLSPLHAGIGKVPAIIALTTYSLLPIIRNTFISITQTDSSIIQAARGMGMTNIDIILKIRIPLSLPVIMAGVRNAAVMGIGITTIAFLIGAGGLGFFIFEGIARTNRTMIIAGTIVVTILGIGTNYLLLFIEDIITPKGLKIKKAEH